MMSAQQDSPGAVFTPTPASGAASAGSHRDQCQLLIEAARLSGDVEALVRAVCAAADDSLLLDDLQEATWYVVRGLSALSRLPATVRDVPSRWALADLALSVAQCWRAQGEAFQSRRLQELLRDTCFEAVRHAAEVADDGVREAILSRVANLLDNLGDSVDAEVLRQQAARRPGSSAQVVSFNRR